MRIKNLPEDERPMEKALSQGMDRLTNPELCALLLGSGARGKSAIELAEEILSAAGGISGLVELTAQELMEFNGVGGSKAARLLAAVELGKRISLTPRTKRVNVACAREIAALFMESLRREKREHFKALLMNTKLEIISVETISVGELNSAPVHPREVFSPAVRKSAAAVAFVHNHPSGDPEPSEKDVVTTRRLCRAGELLGIRVVDHLIIGDGEYVSLAERGII